GAHGAIERDPRHHLRMDEVLRLAADLPDALVRLAPDPFEVVEEHLLQLPRVPLELEPVRTRLVERVDHLSEHVDLKLLARGVADAHRSRILVAAEPWQLELREPPPAAHAVHALDICRLARARP